MFNFPPLFLPGVGRRHGFIVEADSRRIRHSLAQVAAFDRMDDIDILAARIVLVALVDNLDGDIHVVDSFQGPACLADKDRERLK